MLKTVGASGQVSLGKKLAGKHFEVEEFADGSILLAPVTISRTINQHRRAKAIAGEAAKPVFHIFQVSSDFDLPDRQKLHERESSALLVQP